MAVRAFAKYSQSGEILSVIKTEQVPEGLEHPYGPLNAGEAVLEIPEDHPAFGLDVLQVHEGYRVDPHANKLVKRRR